MPQKGKILALDYGTTKIGLAVSDDSRLLAFGRGVLLRSSALNKIFEQIKRLCEKENVTEFVLGLPLNDEGEEGESAKKVRNFSKKLGLYFPEINLNFIDESFSSFEAKNLQHQTGSHGHDDELAATIILQRYLDKL